MESAFQHNLIDAYASLVTAVAAGVILVTGFQRADAIDRYKDTSSAMTAITVIKNNAMRNMPTTLRMRRRYGGGPGFEALRTYLSKRDANRRQLLELARHLNVETALLQALEILG